jgi:GNAT superfamily N-acetyltransferase
MTTTPPDNIESRFDHTPLLKTDIAPVMHLYRESIQPVWLESGRDHDLGRIEGNIRARFNTPDYWMNVARPADRPTEALVGYLAWEKHEDHTSVHTVAHLRMILVHPAQQGSGLGQALMTRFEDAARAEGCTKILFDVVVGSAAREFYRTLGYRHWSDYLEKNL